MFCDRRMTSTLFMNEQHGSWFKLLFRRFFFHFDSGNFLITTFFSRLCQSLQSAAPAANAAGWKLRTYSRTSRFLSFGYKQLWYVNNGFWNHRHTYIYIPKTEFQHTRVSTVSCACITTTVDRYVDDETKNENRMPCGRFRPRQNVQ